MHKIVHGALSFRRHMFSAYRDLFQRLAHNGQNPEALYIGCSDSRVVPNLITMSDPGDLFVVRNVGGLVPPPGDPDASVASAVDYAVGVLGVGDIIVCGHTRCGAMVAILEGQAPDGALGRWLEHGRPARELLERYYVDLTTAEARLERLCQVSVLVQLDRLKAHPIVAERVDRGDLHVHAWVFDVESAQLTAYDPEQERFVGLEEHARKRGGARPDAA